MNVGFTGTRAGMTLTQMEQLQDVLIWLDNGANALVFHHGDCPDGADRQAAAAASQIGYTVEPHPPRVPGSAAALLARDRDIANICDVLIAAPRSDKEELRSGTWATVRYARQAHKPIVMLSRGER